MISMHITNQPKTPLDRIMAIEKSDIHALEVIFAI